MAAQALYRPQGTCPKPWVAAVNGQPLHDGRGGLRRFATEAAARIAASVAQEGFDHRYEPGAYGVCRRCGEERH